MPEFTPNVLGSNVRQLSDYEQWCRQHGCQHAHCPEGCNHPQPFMHRGILICGRCAVISGGVTEMEPCGTAIC